MGAAFRDLTTTEWDQMSSPAEASAKRTRVARRLERRQRQVARVVFEIARGHARKRYSPEMVIFNLAIGADDVQRRLRKHGVHASPNTIREDLGPATGRMAKAADGQPAYKRARTFNLTLVAERFGDYGKRLLAEFIEWADSRTHSALSASSSPRASGYLKWAVENVHEGVRSTVGNRMAWACATKFGLSEAETARLMTEYQEAVDLPANRYLPREAMVTVRSVYRRVACDDPLR
jgi:hypothetical protein